jgi:ABC-type sugar transport systems, permease components
MYIFVLPAAIMFLIFWIFPIIQLFGYSVTDFNGVNTNYNFVGFQNFQTIFKEGTLPTAVKNTLLYTVFMAVISNVLALLLSFVLNAKIRLRGFYRSAAYLPTLFSAIVVGFIWTYVYMPDSGLIASIMKLIGLDGSNFNVLGNYNTALFGIAIVEIWKTIGTSIIIYLAGLQGVDETLLEAGRIDGGNEWQIIRNIQIPLLSPSITINVVLSVINGLKAFDYSFIMTNGGPGKSTNTLMYVIYKMAFIEQTFGKAASFSVVSFFIIIIITAFMVFYMNKREVEL